MELGLHTYQALLELLRASLWGAPMKDGVMPLSAAEWLELYEQSRKQGVHTLIYDAVEALPREWAPPRELIARWMIEMEKVEILNSSMDAAVTAQNKSWKSHGLQAVLLKGQRLASMYPNPSRRICGDIDWYFPSENDWLQANEIARNVGCSPEKDSDGDVHYQWGGITVEHHRGWYHLGSRKASECLSNLERGYDEWNGVPVLRPELELLMIDVHILKHAMVLGVGLRQICDLAVAFKAFAGRIDPDRFAAISAQIGLTRWNELIFSVVTDVIGLEEGFLPYPLDRHRSTDKFMRLVMDDGNLGMHRGDSFGTLKGIRKAGYMFNAYMRRTGLYLYYAPEELHSRSWNLLIGRISR